jgi:hypothetical protein
VTDVPSPRPAVDDGLVTIACREFVELVTEHMEGTLPDALERAIAEHLELCEPCVIYLEQMRATVTALHGLPTPALPPPARERLLRVFAALHGGAGSAERG